MTDKLIASFPKMSSKELAEVRKKAESWVATGSAPQKANAQKVLQALDLNEQKAAEELAEHVRNLPRARRIVEAFQADPLTKTDALVVQVLLDHPTSSSEVLSEKAGWNGQTWHLHFGMMCERRKQRLWPAPKHELNDKAFYTGILADYDMATHGWTMKPEATEAFSELGLRPKVRHEPT